MRIKKITMYVSTLCMLAFSIMNGKEVLAESVTDSDQTSATVSFKEGALTLDTVTGDIAFGSDHEITAEAQTLNSDKGIEVNLTDNRGYSTENTWKLTAQLSNFKQDGKNTLNGAGIKLAGGTANTQMSTVAKPHIYNIESLVAGGDEITVSKADRSEDDSMGIGSWNLKWEDISLYIPQNKAESGNHTATITWILSDAL